MKIPKIDYTNYDINDCIEIENEDILRNLEKYENNIEIILENKNDWHTLKELSYDRENIISWYPLKKTDSILEINAKTGPLSMYLSSICEKITIIENSKTNCKIIQNRCIGKENIEIICSPIEKYQPKEKYDYIIIENLSNNTLKELFEYIIPLLKENGKILYFFENKISIKNLITTDKNQDAIYTRYEVEEIIKEENLFANFYFIFPNIYIPELVFTEEYLEINKDLSYNPMYYDNNIVSQYEDKLFKQLVKENNIKNLANAYFVEIAKKSSKKQILFTKYNNYRKNEYNLITYYQEGKYYKKAKFASSQNFLNQVIENYRELDKMNLDYVKLNKEDYTIYTQELKGINLFDMITEKSQKNFNSIINYLTPFLNQIKEIYQEEIKVSPQKSIFAKYNIKIDAEKSKKLHYVEKLFIDMIPKNVIVKDEKYYFFDQEWVMENAPLEFLYYRIIRYTILVLNLDTNLMPVALDIFSLREYENIFKNLEDEFVNATRNSWYKHYINLYNFTTIPLLEESEKKKELEIKRLKETISRQESEITRLNNEIHKILGSKSWKVTKPLRKIAGNRN